jgi:hypothetical protein
LYIFHAIIVLDTFLYQVVSHCYWEQFLKEERSMFYSRRMKIAFIAAFLTLLILTVSAVIVFSGGLEAGIATFQHGFAYRLC